MKRIMLVSFLVVIMLAFSTTLVCAGGQQEAEEELQIWSQWAAEPAAVEAIEYVVEGYEKESGVSVELEFFERAQLEDAFRTVMAAGGEDAPDIATYSVWPPVIEPGWFQRLDDIIEEDRFVDGAIDRWELGESPKGIYRFPLYVAIQYILYNPKAFDEAGIQVPEDRTFTTSEFVEVVEKLNEAGYAGVANAVGNRPYHGQEIFHRFALTKLGPERYNQLFSGHLDWSEPDIREILEYIVELREAGMFHESFRSMGLEEAHVYFHTQQEAGMYFVGSWYVNRAFQDVDRGGQPRDFKFGMLRYPVFPDSEAPNMILRQSASGGFGIVSTAENKELAVDFLDHWQRHPEYGAVYSALTNQVSALRYSSEDMPDAYADTGEQWEWYHDQLNTVYGDAPQHPDKIGESKSGEFNTEMENVLNVGLPGGLMDVDEAIERLNSARMDVPGVSN